MGWILPACRQAGFVTICTKNKVNLFGGLSDEKMFLNEIGEIANKFWLEIPEHFSNCELDEFVIMPNHIHGILVIDEEQDKFSGRVQTCLNPTENETDSEKEFLKNRPYQKLFKIIGSFKSAVSRNVRQNGFNFTWQKSFYDHIIRNEESLNKIRQYIIDNPRNWDKDEENLENVNI